MSTGKSARLFLADSTTMHFTRTQVLASRNTEAGAVNGRASNGRSEWVTQENRLTYGDWQRQGVEDAIKETAA